MYAFLFGRKLCEEIRWDMYLFYLRSISRRNVDGFRQLSECFVPETQEMLTVSRDSN